jgi:NAD(P)-dependent dehydrogenase (short-subunit alcohol dehydrogenase family)
MLYLKNGPLDLTTTPEGTTLDDLMTQICWKTPAGRLATVEEIANVVEALCMPEFKFVNGQAIVVDGGGVTV